MKNDYKKVIQDYEKLDARGKIAFKNVLHRIDEREKLETLSLRSSIANQLMTDLVKPDGSPYISVDWVAKNILKFTDKEIKELKNKK